MSWPGAVTTDSHQPPMERWPREPVRAVALAYHRALAEGGLDPEATAAAREAYLVAGGDPDEIASAIHTIVAEVTRLHGEWFWRPVKARIERENRRLHHVALWPPPLDRSKWPPVPPDFPWTRRQSARVR